MFKDNIERTIGFVLKEKGHELVEVNAECIFYVKKLSDKLAFHVRCSHDDVYESSVRIILFFTTVDASYEDITKSTVGLQIPIIITGPERDFRTVISDIFQDDVMIAAAKKIIAIEESIGVETGKVILEEVHV